MTQLRLLWVSQVSLLSGAAHAVSRSQQEEGSSMAWDVLRTSPAGQEASEEAEGPVRGQSWLSNRTFFSERLWLEINMDTSVDCLMDMPSGQTSLWTP